MRHPLAFPCVALLLALASCASSTPPVPVAAEVPGSILVADVGVPATVRSMFLTVYPTPRRVEYGDTLLPLAGALSVDDASADFDERLRAAGLDTGWKSLRREGYVLCVTSEDGRAVVLCAAHDDAGRKWAEQALAQVTYETPSGRYVRECRILDEPVFALRGGKRPQAWETNYRANFAWGAKDDADHRGRIMAAVYAPPMPLDATGEGVARTLDFFRPWQDRGVRHFVVKFDDESYAITPETALRLGQFPTALVSYVKLVRQGLRRCDADARLYLLPQTYWWNDPRFDAFTAAVRAAGGFDEDLGLVFTGPEVVSDVIDVQGLAAARRAFGLTETKALLYDNLGREGDWGPLSGRGADLAHHADGVFGERGTPVHRLTRLDWLWNPQAYDPETSWRRALLEIAGPYGFEKFEAICRAFRRGESRGDVAALIDAFANSPEGAWRSPVPRRELVTLLRGDCAHLPAQATAAESGGESPVRSR